MWMEKKELESESSCAGDRDGLGERGNRSRRFLEAPKDKSLGEAPCSEVNHEQCLDLLFCLALLEVQTPRTGAATPVLEVYQDLLVSLCTFRASAGTGWTRTATHVRVGSQAAAAFDWIRRSCRSELHALGSPSCMSLTCFPLHSPPVMLYWIASGPPEREEQFQKLKQKYGSAFAYHGSSPGNWSSILRHGLRNLSHTSRMANGAAYGDGVYLTAHSQLAASYSRVQFIPATEADEASMASRSDVLPDPAKLRIMALCEVAEVPAPGLERTRKQGIWIASEDGIVAVRLLLVFLEGSTSKLPSAQELAQALLSVLPQPSVQFQGPSAGLTRMPGNVFSFPVIEVTLPTFARIGVQSSKSHWAFHVHARCSGDADTEAVAENDHGICRRYSEFVMLRDRIGDGPRAPFPPKWPIRSGLLGLSRELLEVRRIALERWLQEVVNAARRGLLREDLTPELCAFMGAWGSSGQ